jgi:hypothetical protein
MPLISNLPSSYLTIPDADKVRVHRYNTVKNLMVSQFFGTARSKVVKIRPEFKAIYRQNLWASRGVQNKIPGSGIQKLPVNYDV